MITKLIESEGRGILKPMNRPLIITIGVVIILLVLAVWVYLMLFGAPKNSGEIFSNLGFELSSQETTITPPIANTPLPEVMVDITGEALRQLTTRPVAGFVFIEAASSTALRYVERGTGHVYEIDLTTGREEALSRTTIPRATEAVFAPGGDTVAVTSYNGYTPSVFVGTLGTEINLTGIKLQPGTKNIAFSSPNDVLYTITAEGTTKGYRHNIETLSQTELFSFNFSNVDVGWGSDLEKIYLATKPAHNLEGYIYSVRNNSLTPEIPAAYGQSALFSDTYLLTTYTQAGVYKSAAYQNTSERFELPLLTLKEKCVFDPFTTHYVWCAAPVDTTNPQFVEDWYKGVHTSEDKLWLINIQRGEAQLYVDFLKESGRTIDVQGISISGDSTALSFINKLDHTLWLYDLTIK